MKLLMLTLKRVQVWSVIALLTMMSAMTNHAFGQFYPGGIGSSSDVLYWYHADDVASGTTIPVWTDRANGWNAEVVKGNLLELNGTQAFSVNSTYNNYGGSGTEVSLSAWIKPSANTNISYTAGDDMSSSGNNYVLYPNDPSSLFMIGLTAGNNGIVVSTHSVTDANPKATFIYDNSSTPWTGWVHVTITTETVSSHSQVRVYINGTEVTASGGFTISALHPSFSTQLSGIASNLYSGQMDNIAYYDGTLSAISVGQLYAGTYSATTPDIRWNFENNYSPVVTDLAHTNYNNTLTTGNANFIRNGGQDGTTISAPPSYEYSTVFRHHHSVRFSSTSTDNRLRINDKDIINLNSSFSGRSLYLAFSANNITTRQVIYKEGNDDQGLVIYIDTDSKLYLHVYNKTSVSSCNAWTTPALTPGRIYGGVTIATGQAYLLSFTLAPSTSGGTLDVKAFLNGTSFINTTASGDWCRHTGGIVLGGNYNDFRDATDAKISADCFFDGNIAALVTYAAGHNTAQRRIIENAMSSDNGTTLSNDLYTYETTHIHNIYGIGKESSSDTHTPNTNGVLTITATDFSTNSNGSYLIIGDDNGSMATIDMLSGLLSSSDATAKNVNRFLRTFRIGGSGNVVRSNINIPASYFTLDAHQKPCIILLSGTAASTLNFTNPYIVVASGTSGSDYVFNNVPVGGGHLLFIGVLNQYEYASTYTSSVATMGITSVGYDVHSTTLDGVTIINPRDLALNEHLLMAHQAGTVTFNNSNVPAALATSTALRMNRVFRINQYGNIGNVDLYLDPALYPLNSGSGQQYILLVDADGDGDFSNASYYGMTKSGAQYAAFNISLPQGATMSLVSGDHVIVQPENLSCTFVEGSLQLSSHDHCTLRPSDDANFGYAGQCPREISKSVLNINFSTGTDHVFGNYPFTASATVEVRSYLTTNPSLGDPYEVLYTTTLAIDQDSPEKQYFMNVTEGVQGNIKSYIVHMSAFSTTSTYQPLIDALTVKAWLDQEYEVGMIVSTASPIQNTTSTLGAGGALYTFNWTTDQCHAGSYQFQLLRLYKKFDNDAEPTINVPSGEDMVTADIDWNKALTLETNDPTIALTMAEGTGYYLWRVRPIGNQYEGGVADSRNWGNWSTDGLGLSSTVTLSACTTSTCLDTYAGMLFWYNQFDQDKNFIFQRTFTENSGIHEGITYANGLMQTRQTQARIPSNNDGNDLVNTDGEMLVAQQYYDFSGRSALASMPAPVFTKSTTSGTADVHEFGYVKSFMSVSGNVYTADNFDDDDVYGLTCNDYDETLTDVDGGAANTYYNSLNPLSDPSIPDADGFPFTRSIYATDGTGRVVEQGSVGPDHQPGSEHTVRYAYAAVTEAELVYMFGNEAPNPNSVYKTITTDQNNISSVAYIDKQGRTIGTCLINNGKTTQLDALPTKPDEEEEYFTATGELSDKDNRPTSDGKGLIGNTSVNVLTDGSKLTLSYELTQADVKSQCGEICYSCGYTVTIKVTSTATCDTDPVKFEEAYPIAGAELPTGECDEANSSTPIDLDPTEDGNTVELTLDAGTYVIERTITLNPAASTAYVSAVTAAVQSEMTALLTDVKAALTANDLSAYKDALTALLEDEDTDGSYYAELIDATGVIIYSTHDAASGNNTFAPEMLVEGTTVRVVTECCSVEIPMLVDQSFCVRYTTSATRAEAMVDLFVAETNFTASDLNGFTLVELEAMLTNMLNETVGGNPLYECQKVYECWLGMIETHKAINATGGTNISTGISTGLTDSGAGFLSGAVSGSTSSVNYVEQFLECVGKHYKGYVFAGDHESEYKARPYFYFMHPGASTDYGNLMKDCDRMFCLTVPSEVVNGGTATTTPMSRCSASGCDVTHLEVSSTYYVLHVEYTDINSIPQAFDVTTETDLNVLYQCLKSSNTNTAVTITQTEAAELMEEQAEEIEKQCLTACQARYPEFLAHLEQMYDPDGNGVYQTYTYGSELQVNGDFDVDNAGWYYSSTTYSGTTIPSSRWISNKYYISGYSNLLQSLTTFTSTTVYSIEFDISGLPGGVYSAPVPLDIAGINITKNGHYKGQFTGLTTLQILLNPSAQACYIDNISVKEVTGTTTIGHDELCCSAQTLVNNCNDWCQLDVQYEDCTPTDIAYAVGTPEQINTVAAIMYGDYQLQESDGEDCPAGFDLIGSTNLPTPLGCQDGNGSIDWEYTLGGGGGDLDITELPDGSYIAIGHPATAANATTLNSNNGGGDILVYHYSKSGTFLWARYVGSSLDDNMSRSECVHVDDLNNIYLAWIEPATGSLPVVSHITKLDINGSLVSQGNFSGKNITCMRRFENGDFIALSGLDEITYITSTYSVVVSYTIPTISSLPNNGGDYLHHISIDDKHYVYVIGQKQDASSTTKSYLAKFGPFNSSTSYGGVQWEVLDGDISTHYLNHLIVDNNRQVAYASFGNRIACYRLSNGQNIWDKILPVNISQKILMSNGDLAYSSSITSPSGHLDIQIGIISRLSGNVTKTINLGGSATEILDGSINESHGYITIAGSSMSSSITVRSSTVYSAGVMDIYIARLDMNLNLVQHDLLGCNNFDSFSSSTGNPSRKFNIITSDNSLLILAYSASSSCTEKHEGYYAVNDMWLIKYKFGSNNTCTPRSLCVKWIPPAETVYPPDPTNTPDPTVTTQVTETVASITAQLSNCQLANTSGIALEYEQSCLDNGFHDNLEYSLSYGLYHYTLYYYDRGGHLVKTVPPQGFDDDKTKTRDDRPDHDMFTVYQYNSLGQLTFQSSPDGGDTYFYYDDLGKLRFSQNAKQAATSPLQSYSYTKYDYLSRIIEVGEATLPSGVTTPAGLTSFTTLINQVGAGSYPTTGTSQQTFTVYSEPANQLHYLGETQSYLRNRVSYVYTIGLTGEKAYTGYSYDPHGNVKWLIQQVPGLTQNTIAYDYDLISNKVLKAKYNEQRPDQFFHQYEYDTDNRITAVLTSRDDKLWDQDADYNYFKHGPLQRAEIGEDHIQGLDYTYTLHGWIKATNSHTLDVTHDPGQDGASGSKFAKDEFGMVLGYYRGDFLNTNSFLYTIPAGGSNLHVNGSRQLYNGNISYWESRIEQEFRDYRDDPANSSVTMTPSVISSFTTVNQYEYDELNRITNSDFAKYDVATLSWNSSVQFHTEYTYDANGNILTLDRNGNLTATGDELMDDLGYTYGAAVDAHGRKKNQLTHVSDGVSNNALYADDIDDNSGANNYTYDAIGNLIADGGEKIGSITWTVYGKVDAVTPLVMSSGQKPALKYFYDATGQRIRKEVNAVPYDGGGLPQRLPEHITTTYYVRDASGNVMGVYERKNAVIPSETGYYTATWKVKELPIYGSSRVGEVKIDDIVAEKKFYKDDMDKISFYNEQVQEISEYQNWVGTSEEIITFNNSSAVPQKFRTFNIQEFNYNSGTGHYVVQQVLQNGLGKALQVAIAEDDNGNLQFFAIGYEDYWGIATSTIKARTILYDKNGHMLPGQVSTSFTEPFAEISIFRLPGSTTKYVVASLSFQTHMFSGRVIDMSLPGNGTTGSPLGDVTSTYLGNPLGYVHSTINNYAMQVVEKRDQDLVSVYNLRFPESAPTTGLTTLELWRNDVHSSGATTSYDPIQLVIATPIPTKALGHTGEMSISPDGRKLALLVYEQKQGWYDHQKTKVYVYDLGMDGNLAQNGIACSKQYTLEEYSRQGMSIDWSDDGRFLYLTEDVIGKQSSTAGTQKLLWRIDLRTDAQALLQSGVNGDIRRGIDGKMYIANILSNKVECWDEDPNTGAAVRMNTYDVTTSPSTATMSGYLPHNSLRWLEGDATSGTVARNIGDKYYELNDHLGNVTVVVGDQLNAALVSSTFTTEAHVWSYTNYYPFGMAMPGRELEDAYRYGHNGQEKDDEIFKGAYTAEYWEYDSRTGRRWNVDPVIKSWESPYASFHNNPIYFVDPAGNDPWDRALKWIRKSEERYGDVYDNDIERNSDGSVSARIYRHSDSQKEYTEGSIYPNARIGGYRRFDRTRGEKFIDWLWDIGTAADANTYGEGTTGHAAGKVVADATGGFFMASIHLYTMISEGKNGWGEEATGTNYVLTAIDLIPGGGAKNVVKSLGTKYVDELLDITFGGTKLLLKSAPAVLTQKALDHIIDRHWFTSGYSKVGKFSQGTTGQGLKEMIETTSTQGVFKPGTNGRAGTIAEYTFGQVIGTSSSGKPTNRLRVVINPDGTVETAFPF